MNPTRIMAAAGQPGDPFADFRNFLHYLFTEVRGWPDVHALQYDIADFMQHLPVCKDGKRRGQVQSLRGAGKTEIACAFCLWLLYMDPDVKILVVSSVLSKAQEFVDLARQIINTAPLLAHLKPQLAKDGLVEKDQKDNLHGFVVGAVTRVSKELSLASFPIFGTYTGSHPDWIIADDIETPENSLTVGKRIKLMGKVNEFEDLLVNPTGGLLGLGTPQTEDSIYNQMEKAGYQIRRWPARFPSLTDQTACTNVAPMLLKMLQSQQVQPGAPTYPERFNEEVLLQRLAAYGPARFGLQMLLDTTLSDADRYPLKLKNLIVMECHYEMAPESVLWGTTFPVNIDPQGLTGDSYFGPSYRAEKYAPYITGVMWIDPKGSGEDTVGYAVVKALNGVLYCLECGGVAKGQGQDGTSDSVLTKLAKIAAKYGIKKVAVEKNFGNGMYSKLLAPIMAKVNGPTEIVDRTSKGQKERRIIDVLGPLTEAHKLVVTPQVASNDTLMRQYTRITTEPGALLHEDELEALAAACGELSDLVRLDPEKREQEEAAAEKKRMIKAFERDAVGFVGAGAGRTGTGKWTNRTARWGRFGRR